MMYPAGQAYGVSLVAQVNPIVTATGARIPNAYSINAQGKPIDVNGNVLNFDGSFANPNNLMPGTYNPNTATVTPGSPVVPPPPAQPSPSPVDLAVGAGIAVVVLYLLFA
jgi:hypothetical protein